MQHDKNNLLPSCELLEQVRCFICRDTKANAQQLTPVKAYHINQNIMEVMDLMGMGATCR